MWEKHDREQSGWKEDRMEKAGEESRWEQRREKLNSEIRIWSLFNDDDGHEDGVLFLVWFVRRAKAKPNVGTACLFSVPCSLL